MSRSYKRVPCCKDHNKGAKQYANRYVRRKYLEVPSGKAYKKLFSSWDICDYKFLYSFCDYKNNFEMYSHIHHKKYSDRELYKRWYKYYKMK